MWVSLQATVQCAACQHSTAANAAVDTLHCDGCGAELTIHPQLWQSSLQSAIETGLELDANGVHEVQHQQGGSRLSLRIARVPPECPHCQGDISDTRPSTDLDCPHCAVPISVRSLPDVQGQLVGEDRALLAGQQREDSSPERVSCPSCGTSVLVDGSSRSPACSACDGQLVIPDEVWRRVHAPGSVAAWFLYTEHEPAETFQGYLYFMALTVGPNDVLYAQGTHNDGERIFAFDTKKRQLLWSKPWEDVGGQARVVLVGDTLWVHDDQRAQLLALDPTTGKKRSKIHVEGTHGIQTVIDGGDGTLLLTLYPETGLSRVSTTGEPRELWPPVGFFARLFGSNGYVHSAPVARPARLAQNTAFLVARPRGGAHLISTGDGVQLGTVSPDGSLLRSVSLPLVICDGRAAAAPDGTVHILGGRSGASVWVRVRDQQVDELLVAAHENASGGGPPILSGVLAVGPDGDVWLADGGKLTRYDGDGRLKWSFSS